MWRAQPDPKTESADDSDISANLYEPKTLPSTSASGQNVQPQKTLRKKSKEKPETSMAFAVMKMPKIQKRRKPPAKTSLTYDQLVKNFTKSKNATFDEPEYEEF